MKNPTETDSLLKAIAKELKTILEKDIRKIMDPKDRQIKDAAFLQMIAA